MNNILKLFICFLFILTLLTGCKRYEVTIITNIIEKSDNMILVGEKDSNLLGYKVPIDDETIILDNNGKRIQFSDLQEGQKVELIHNGKMTESLPSTVQKCYQIKILNE